MKAIISIILTITFFITANAQINYQPNTIKVNGSSERFVEPNEVHLVVRIQEVRNKKEVNNISIETARSEFLNICKKVRISNEDIDMSYMRSQLIKQKVSFWRRARTGLVQREVYDIKFTDMNKMLLFVERIDRRFVNSISFGKQTHTEMVKFRKEVKMDATKAATEKATYLAKAGGQEIGKVIYIEEKDDTYFTRQHQYSNRISYDKKISGGAPNVHFGFEPIRIRYEVEVVCELK